MTEAEIYQQFIETLFLATWVKPSLDIICPVQNGEILWTDPHFLKLFQVIVQTKIRRLALDSMILQFITSEEILMSDTSLAIALGDLTSIFAKYIFIL